MCLCVCVCVCVCVCLCVCVCVCVCVSVTSLLSSLCTLIRICELGITFDSTLVIKSLFLSIS